MVKWVLNYVVISCGHFSKCVSLNISTFTKGKKRALCVQISLEFAEISKIIFCTFDMLIMMFQEKDMVCRISQAYLAK